MGFLSIDTHISLSLSLSFSIHPPSLPFDQTGGHRRREQAGEDWDEWAEGQAEDGVGESTEGEGERAGGGPQSSATGSGQEGGDSLLTAQPAHCGPQAGGTPGDAAGETAKRTPQVVVNSALSQMSFYPLLLSYFDNLISLPFLRHSYMYVYMYYYTYMYVLSYSIIPNVCNTLQCQNTCMIIVTRFDCPCTYIAWLSKTVISPTLPQLGKTIPSFCPSHHSTGPYIGWEKCEKCSPKRLN